jgi:alkanesulfonate monooxygenase SsuD/methylene tetrahydromethanopterin reductase-like flavin-dependent oxidoreductase (luciferase family)
LGFDSIWLVDHFANLIDSGTAWMEAWSLLAGIAACTDRIQVGSLVSTLIYRNPALLAKQAMTVDHISGGRLTLGLGAGSSADPSHAMTGVPAWPAHERASRFGEGVEIIDRMLRETETTFEGEYYRAESAVMRPRPLQRPRLPLLIGCQGRRMLEIAGRYADTWNMLGDLQWSYDAFVAHAAEAVHALTESAVAAGREPDTIRRSFCLGWTMEDLYQSPGTFQAYLHPLIELGFTEFMIGYWNPADIDRAAPIRHVQDDETLERIASTAIPSLRSLVQPCHI